MDFKSIEKSVFVMENRQLKNHCDFTHFPQEKAHFRCTRTAHALYHTQYVNTSNESLFIVESTNRIIFRIICHKIIKFK